ncbi:hypothetical protein GCM10027614_80960 [Micromonospora vulcania]
MAGVDGDGGADTGGRRATGAAVAGAPGGLGSILDELISNALRLSDAQEVEVTARVAPGATGAGPGDGSAAEGVVTIMVRDDGRGIDVSERAQALRRFWRSPRHQNVSGTGLGLAICADLVRGPVASCGWRMACHVRTGPGTGSPR